MPRGTTGGRLGGALLVCAGLVTLVNDYLPGSELLDVPLLNTVALVAIAAGLLAYVAPWARWHPRASLLLAPVGFGLIAVSNRYGGVSSYSYAVYFVVIFVWVGIAHPPGTSALLAAPAAATYVLPLALSDHRLPNAISSVTVAIPVCVLVGETIARTVRRHAQAQDALADRARRVERLATLVGELNADLDVDAVLQRTCHAARELLDADATELVTSGEALRLREPLVVDDLARYPHLMDGIATVPGLHTVLVVPTVGRGTVRGALYALFAAPGRTVSATEVGVATLLAGHAGAALANAATYADVVRAHAHEQAVVDGMADGMAVVGADGSVVGWNAAAAALTGLPADVVVGGPLPFPAGPPRVTTDHRLPDGRWIEVLPSPIDAAGETVVSFRDVSAAKALDEAKDMFLATTSHELRTPITVIKGYVAVLRRNWAQLTDVERADAMAAIEDRTDSLVGLVNHLLLGARAGAARYSVEVAPFELEPAVRAAAQGLSVTSDRHTIVVDIPDELPYVLGDPASIEPVVGQLVENAVKYSPLGGEVRVLVHGGDGYAVVDVLDRGVGIREDAREQLFTRFYQAQATNRREYAGMGLGLHIVRELVEAQGGTVHAENRPGGGARIGFTLPYAPAVPSPRSARAPSFSEDHHA